MGYFIHEDQPAGLPFANLEELNDVNIENPADGDALVYDSTAGKWQNSKFAVETKSFGGNTNNLFIENSKRLLSFNGGVTGANGLLGTLDATDRPPLYIYSLCVIYNGGSYYTGYLNINPTNGVVTARYFVPGTSTDAPVGSGSYVYGEASWYV